MRAGPEAQLFFERQDQKSVSFLVTKQGSKCHASDATSKQSRQPAAVDD